MAESGFNFAKLIEDSKTVLTKPKEYFSSMPKEGGYGEPVIKALIYGLIGGIIGFIWAMLNLTSGPLGSTAGGSTAAITVFITSVIASVIGLFIGGLIILIISAICGGSTKYEANVRVTAALMVLGPVQTLFSFLSGINIYLGMIVSLIIALYSLWLMYNALISGLQAKEGAAKVLCVIIAALIALMMIGSITCMQKASELGDQLYKQESDKIMKEIPDNEELQKSLERMRESLQKMQKENK